MLYNISEDSTCQLHVGQPLRYETVNCIYEFKRRWVVTPLCKKKYVAVNFFDLKKKIISNYLLMIAVTDKAMLKYESNSLHFI